VLFAVHTPLGESIIRIQPCVKEPSVERNGVAGYSVDEQRYYGDDLAHNDRFLVDYE